LICDFSHAHLRIEQGQGSPAIPGKSDKELLVEHGDLLSRAAALEETG